MILKKGIALACWITATGCGSLISGTKQEIKFSSDVEGATVLINDEEVCKTPCTHKLKRAYKQHLITIKKESYPEQNFQMESTLNLVSLLNIPLPGMIVWVGIDVFAGGAWKYKKDSYYAVLMPVSESIVEDNKGIENDECECD